MSGESDRKTSWGAVALVLLLVLALYVLSLGPACVIANRAKATQPVLEIVYTPLQWLVNSNDFVERVLWKYVEFWLEITDTPLPF